MSDIPRAGLSRRQLLRGGLALAAWTLGPHWARAQEMPDVPPPEMPLPPCDPKCTRWALLSDTHIAADPEDRYRGFYPHRNLQEVTAQIAWDPPDGVVVTGDLARTRGETEAYENFKTLLSPIAGPRPIHLALGNHDDRGDFFRSFGPGYDDGAVENKHVVTTEMGPVRLIVLDSLLNVNWMTGKLGPEQRIWLETILQTCDDRPTILFLHHTLNGELLDMRRLLEIIKPVPKIKAVVYGHSHKYGYSEFAGIHLINLPATGFTLTRRQPVGWVEARLTKDSGEFTLHAIGGDRENDGRTQTLAWRS